LNVASPLGLQAALSSAPKSTALREQRLTAVACASMPAQCDSIRQAASAVDFCRPGRAARSCEGRRALEQSAVAGRFCACCLLSLKARDFRLDEQSS